MPNKIRMQKAIFEEQEEKHFILQQCQQFSQFSKPFVAQNLNHDQTSVTLMKLVRNLKEDKRNQKLIDNMQFMPKFT